jgi:hypothetical protein
LEKEERDNLFILQTFLHYEQLFQTKVHSVFRNFSLCFVIFELKIFGEKSCSKNVGEIDHMMTFTMVELVGKTRLQCNRELERKDKR